MHIKNSIWTLGLQKIIFYIIFPNTDITWRGHVNWHIFNQWQIVCFDPHPHNTHQNISGDQGFESDESRINMHFVAFIVLKKKSPINSYLIQSHSGTWVVLNVSIDHLHSSVNHHHSINHCRTCPLVRYTIVFIRNRGTKLKIPDYDFAFNQIYIFKIWIIVTFLLLDERQRL